MRRSSALMARSSREKQGLVPGVDHRMETFGQHRRAAGKRHRNEFRGGDCQVPCHGGDNSGGAIARADPGGAVTAMAAIAPLETTLRRPLRPASAIH